MLRKIFPLFFVICLVLASCNTGQRIHHPGGKKKRSKDCNCPKWSNIEKNHQLLSFKDGER
jgi:predicted small secreted protein